MPRWTAAGVLQDERLFQAIEREAEQISPLYKNIKIVGLDESGRQRTLHRSGRARTMPLSDRDRAGPGAGGDSASAGLRHRDDRPRGRRPHLRLRLLGRRRSVYVPVRHASGNIRRSRTLRAPARHGLQGPHTARPAHGRLQPRLRPLPLRPLSACGQERHWRTA